MARKYEVRVCEGCGARCEWRVRTYIPCPSCGALKPDGQRMQGETVTTVDLRDVEPLVQALKEAVDMIQDWASYASAYFQEKHDLEGEEDSGA